jgi:hypothetical protein
MKTPVQKLIDSVGWMAQGLDADELYDYFMEEATRMLEKEKEVICDAYMDGQNNGIDISHPLSHINEVGAEQYYEETFKTKER